MPLPDQDPEKLQRLYGRLSGYLGEQLGVSVVYQPVTDYIASVTSFRRGDIDAVFFGGPSGVQARQLVPGAVRLAQRDIDERFRSVFVASPASGIVPIADVAGLSALPQKPSARPCRRTTTMTDALYELTPDRARPGPQSPQQPTGRQR